MPWKELSKMDERMRFVARLVEGEKMAVLCREFDISRKTGYKLFNRFKNSGIEGLTDRSRRPYRHANRLPFQIENLILQLKEKHSSWGAQKIRDKIKLLHRSTCQPSAPCMRCWIDTTWSVARAESATKPKVRRSLKRLGRTICGAPITRASSCSPINAIAIR
jgi:Homeodomain-like domain